MKSALAVMTISLQVGAGSTGAGVTWLRINAKGGDGLDIKEALLMYPTIPEQIRMIREGIAAMSDSRHDTRITAVIRDMPGGGVGPTNPTMEKALSVEAQLRASVDSALGEIEALLALKAVVDAGLKELSVFERRVVELKYFFGVLKWADIGQRLGYSKDRCKHVHKSAIDTLKKKMTRFSTK